MRESFPMSESVESHSGKLRKVQSSFHESSEVELTIRDIDGNIKSVSKGHNLRTNVGANFWSTQLFGFTGSPNVAKYVGMTVDNTAPALTDTTLTGEETSGGLARAMATSSHTLGATTTVLSYTFVYTGSTLKSIAKVGLFDASSSGNLVLETLLNTPGSVTSPGDVIAIVWTINY